MEKGRIDFSISFLEPVGNSEQYGNVQIFVYINSNWVFSKSRSPMEKGRIEFRISLLEPVGISVHNGNFQLFCYIDSNCVSKKKIKNKR